MQISKVKYLMVRYWESTKRKGFWFPRSPYLTTTYVVVSLSATDRDFDQSERVVATDAEVLKHAEPDGPVLRAVR